MTTERILAIAFIGMLAFGLIVLFVLLPEVLSSFLAAVVGIAALIGLLAGILWSTSVVEEMIKERKRAKRSG